MLLEDIFLVGDQPTTCPYCGSRTSFDEMSDGNSLFQAHRCLNPDCAVKFIISEGEE